MYDKENLEYADDDKNLKDDHDYKNPMNHFMRLLFHFCGAARGNSIVLVSQIKQYSK